MNLVRLAATTSATTAVTVAVLAALAIAAAIGIQRMSIAGAIALYFVIWWVFLFAVLPFGVRSQVEEGNVTVGTEPGAPALPMLREKAIWTTLVADVVLLVAGATMPLAGL